MFRAREKIYRTDVWKPLWEFFLFWDSANYFPPSVYVDQNKNDIMNYIFNFYDGPSRVKIIEYKEILHFDLNPYFIELLDGSKVLRVGLMISDKIDGVRLRIYSDGSFDTCMRFNPGAHGTFHWEHTSGLNYIYADKYYV